MTHLAIFDLDGTLVDAFRDIQAAVNAMLAAHGYPAHDLATIRGFVGNGVVRLVERSLPPEGLSHLDESVAFVRRYYEEHPADQAALYPGAAECLKQLRAAGIKLAILSNKPQEISLLVAQRLGLDALVDAIAGERRGFPIKPDPAGVLALRESLGAEHVTMIGDGLPDAEVARNAGVGFIGVDWGLGTRAVLKPHGPVVSGFGELAALLLSERPDSPQ